MAGVNKVIIVGRLGGDPELKTISSGSQVTRFNVATSEEWKDKNSGEKQERTEWHRVVVWGRMAEICAKYLAKGRQVYVEGRLQTNTWEDQNGQKRYTTEVIATTVQFIGGGQSTSSFQSDRGPESSNFPSDDFGPEPTFDSNDDIPF